MARAAAEVAPADVSKIVQMEAPPEPSPTHTLTLEDIGAVTPPLAVQAAAATPPPNDTPPVAIAPEEPEDEPGEPEADDVSADDLEFAATLKAGLADDPIAALEAVWQNIPQDAQAGFLDRLAKTYGGPEALPPGDGEGENAIPFGEASAFEKALKPMFNDLKDIPTFKQNVHGQFQKQAEFINDAHLRLAVAEGMFGAWAKAFGVTLPKADMESMMKSLKSTGSYEKATASHNKAVEKAFVNGQQANKQRPVNTKSEVRNALITTPSMSLHDMIKAAREAAA